MREISQQKNTSFESVCDLKKFRAASLEAARLTRNLLIFCMEIHRKNDHPTLLREFRKHETLELSHRYLQKYF